MKIKTLLIILLLLFFSTTALASVIKFPTNEVLGTGPYPYNYRVIDNHIHAGGHPLNPQTYFMNNDNQALKILDYLKRQGITTIIDLENTPSIQPRYQRLLEQAKIKRIHIPMHNDKLPTKKEWEIIKQVMKYPVYVHCKWGADRTGAIIGRYLVEENNYSSQEAYNAVISRGSYSGYIGGLKTSYLYKKMKDFIWFGPRK